MSSSPIYDQNYNPIPVNSPLLPSASSEPIKFSLLDSGISAAIFPLDPSVSLEPLLYSVVKIFCTSTYPNFSSGWNKKRQSASTCSGFLIDCQRRFILTNAHGVTSASSIRVQRHGDSIKFASKIVVIAHDADLAIITIEDERFWADAKALTFGDVPQLQSSVAVVGFPTGGSHLSISSGIVSRVMMANYSHSGEVLLSVQVDAPINSGNSGGPAIQDSKVVGVAFESLTQAQSIGYIIPVPVIQHFLTDFNRHNRYTGFPRLTVLWNRLENESLKKYLNLPADCQNQGIVVSAVEPLDPAAKILKKSDVILSVDSIPIGEDGTVLFRKGERLSFRYLESLKFVGDSLEMEILRNGEKLKVSTVLECIPTIVPLHSHDQMPEYLIYAGFVFIPLTRAFLYSEWGSNWNQKAPVELVDRAYHAILNESEEQIVILSQILVDDVNVGYSENFHNLSVVSINGERIKNLKAASQLLIKAEKNGEKFIRFELDRDAFIVIEVAAARASEARILSENSIAHSKSADIRKFDEEMEKSENGLIASIAV